MANKLNISHFAPTDFSDPKPPVVIPAIGLVSHSYILNLKLTNKENKMTDCASRHTAAIDQSVPTLTLPHTEV